VATISPLRLENRAERILRDPLIATPRYRTDERASDQITHGNAARATATIRERAKESLSG
jgi:hypothetical protein